ncbi:hypothetical protein SAY87_016069 [Trapa incisa]|uniref:SAM domain-containing protein n=1 Tax=Trapa incisa TaxID=236973 RepID=A0AAN7LBT8_9MYRT|nr:hypothetical protein SAY87_016069 [Trapa incisa]
MSDNRRERVTITLGRAGQVVKRPTKVSDAFIDPMPSVGSKRSIRDRLGSNGDDYLPYKSHINNKRPYGATGSWSSNGLNDVHIDKDDLRHMLMQKNVRRRVERNGEGNGLDLREKLVKTVYSPASTLDTRQRAPERKENGSQPGYNRLPPTRSANNFPPPDPLRSSYSPWSLEHLRQRTPERYRTSSRAYSLQRNEEETHGRPVMRMPDDVRSVTYVRRDINDPPRSMGATPYTTSSKHPGTSMRSPPLLGQNPPPSGSLQRSFPMIDQNQTVDGLLNALELGKYAIIFKAEEVDMAALKQMGEHDLKELGIPMGPRKKILQAVAPRPKRLL